MCVARVRARLRYVPLEVAIGISNLGVRLDRPALIYNPLLFAWYHRQAKRNAPGLVSSLEAEFPEARSWVDVGAGSCAFAAHASRRGRPTDACEHSALGRLMGRVQGVPCTPFDLALPEPAAVRGSYDLAYCIEVAEHLPPELGDRLVEFLSAVAPVVVFTAAHPGQGGQGHVNEQPQSYWIERFERNGMCFDQSRSESVLRRFRENGVVAFWLLENLMVFERSGAEVPGLPR